MYNNAETEKKKKEKRIKVQFLIHSSYSFITRKLYKINSRTRYLILKHFGNLCRKKYTIFVRMQNLVFVICKIVKLLLSF